MNFFLTVTPQQALSEGFTHHGRYYGIPVYLGNLEAATERGEPLAVLIKHNFTAPLFFVATFLEWAFTPPNGGAMFGVGNAIEDPKSK